MTSTTKKTQHSDLTFYMVLVQSKRDRILTSNILLQLKGCFPNPLTNTIMSLSYTFTTMQSLFKKYKNKEEYL